MFLKEIFFIIRNVFTECRNLKLGTDEPSAVQCTIYFVGSVLNILLYEKRIANKKKLHLG